MRVHGGVESVGFELSGVHGFQCGFRHGLVEEGREVGVERICQEADVCAGFDGQHPDLGHAERDRSSDRGV